MSIQPPTHLHLPPRSRAEVDDLLDRPTLAELIERYGSAREIPAGTLVFTKQGNPTAEFVGNGWSRGVRYVEEAPTRPSRREHPDTIQAISHHLRLPIASTRPLQVAGFWWEVRRLVKGSLRGVGELAKVSKSTVDRLTNPDTTLSVGCGALLRVLQTYGLDLRLTRAPYPESNLFLANDGLWAAADLLMRRRRALSLSATGLAQLADVHRSTVSKLESGQLDRVSLGTLLKVCEALGIEPVIETLAGLDSVRLWNRASLMLRVREASSSEDYHRALDALTTARDRRLLAALQWRRDGGEGVESTQMSAQASAILSELWGGAASQNDGQSNALDQRTDDEAARVVTEARYFADLYGESFDEANELSRLEGQNLSVPPHYDFCMQENLL